MNNYYTHRPFLRNELENLNYNNQVICIEFGTGDGSALLFNEFAEKNDNMKIHSYETDNDWLVETKNKYGRENYIFNEVDSWENLLQEKNFNEIYDLVFVDQAPWDARIQSIDLIKNKSKIIILHDYDFFNKGVCEDIYSVSEGSFFFEKYSNEFDFFKYHSTLPPTLVMKNKKLK